MLNKGVEFDSFLFQAGINSFQKKYLFVVLWEIFLPIIFLYFENSNHNNDMSKSKTIIVKETPITIIEVGEQDYISLTDMVKSFGDETIIYNWMRNRNTVEFLGLWEQIYNPVFKPVEFERFKTEAGLNRFSLSPKKWI